MRKAYLLIFLIITLCSCTQEQETEKIRIATLKGPSAIGMVKMIDSIKQDKNSNLEISMYNEPIQVRKLMLQNEVDLAVLPTTMGAILYNKQVPYQLAAIPVWGTLYLFGKDTTIQTWSDLKNKRVHLMAKGMTPDVLFKYLLVQNKIDPIRDVMLDYSFPTHIELANAVAANQADLAVISEPMVSLVMQKNQSVHPIMDLNNEWQKVVDIPIAQTALLVNQRFAQKNNKELQEILKSYDRSTTWVNQNPQQAAELIVKYNILPNREIARKTIPRCNLKFKKTEEIEDIVQRYLQIFYNLDPVIIGGRIPDDNFYLN